MAALALGASLVSPFQAAALAEALAKLGKSMRAERVTLREFFKPAWTVINPTIRYIPNWHNDLIAEHLEAVHTGQIKLLDIEMPPRMGKSFHVTVAFPDWEWTEDPTERFVLASYNQKLCNRHSLDRRKIIQSAWYQNRWGDYVSLADDQNLKTEFQNKAGGHMITVPFGSSATGSGGRRLVIDDPIDPKAANSKIKREAATEFYRGTLTTRLDDEQNSATIIVAQRTHRDDLQGKVVSEKDGWTILKVPMEARKTFRYKFPISGGEHVYEKGAILCPNRMSGGRILALRRQMGKNAAAAQLDQEPAEVEGKMFLRRFWAPLSEAPARLFGVNFWDTAAKDKQENDYCVGVYVYQHARGYHVARMTRDQMRFAALKRAARDLHQTTSPDVIGVEDKSSGQQLLQELVDPDEDARRAGAEPLPAVAPDKDFMKLDKVARANIVQPIFEAGLVSYDPNMDGAEDMLAEFAGFPGGEHDDIVDAVVYAVHYLSRLDRRVTPAEDYEQAEDVEGEI